MRWWKRVANKLISRPRCYTCLIFSITIAIFWYSLLSLFSSCIVLPALNNLLKTLVDPVNFCYQSRSVYLALFVLSNGTRDNTFFIPSLLTQKRLEHFRNAWNTISVTWRCFYLKARFENYEFNASVLRSNVEKAFPGSSLKFIFRSL